LQAFFSIFFKFFQNNQKENGKLSVFVNIIHIFSHFFSIFSNHMHCHSQKAYAQGSKACIRGKNKTKNPFPSFVKTHQKRRRIKI